MKVTISRGYSTASYKLCSFNFDDAKEVYNIFKPARANIKEDSEHFRVDITTESGVQQSYGFFLDIDNSEGEELKFKETCEIVKTLNFNFVGYKTYTSGKNGKDRFRLFIPFSKPCPASLHKYSALKFIDALFLPPDSYDARSLLFRHVMFAPTYPPNKDAKAIELTVFNEGDYFEPIEVTDFSDEEKKDILNSSPSKQWELKDKGSLVYAYVTNVSIEEALATYCKDIYIPTENPSRYRYFESDSAAGAVIYKTPETPGRLFSWHRKDPHALQFLNSYDIMLYFGMYGNRQAARKEATDVFQRAFLSTPAAEQAFTSMCKGTGKWFFFSMLKNMPKMLGDIKEDSFGKRITIRQGSRLLSLTGEEEESLLDSEDFVDLKDDHITFIKDTLADYGRKAVTSVIVQDFLKYFCRQNNFDSLRDHIAELSSDTWDKVERAKHLFELLGAKDSAYNNAVALHMLAGLWYRGMFYNNAEVKYDDVIILEGRQGIGKSTFLKMLAGDPNLFTDETSALGSRNTKMTLSRKWIAELAELRAFYSRSLNVMDIKGFLSQSVDTFRPPWGTASIDVPRRYIFIGTTNRTEGYLKDFTGNRRFFPVECLGLDRDNFINNESRGNERRTYVRQLWAEVKTLHESGLLKKYMVIPEELMGEQATLVATKEATPLSESKIMDYLSRRIPDNFEMLNLTEIINFEKWRNMSNLKVREYVCIEEIIDAVYKETTSLKIVNSCKLEVGKVLEANGWLKGELVGKTVRRSYACYGQKRVYYRPE